MATNSITKYLVVKATGEMRIVAKTNRLGDDEIAVPLTVNIPKAWGMVDKNQGITIDLPEPPTVEKVKLRRIETGPVLAGG